MWTFNATQSLDSGCRSCNVVVVPGSTNFNSTENDLHIISKLLWRTSPHKSSRPMSRSTRTGRVKNSWDPFQDRFLRWHTCVTHRSICTIPKKWGLWCTKREKGGKCRQMQPIFKIFHSAYHFCSMHASCCWRKPEIIISILSATVVSVSYYIINTPIAIFISFCNHVCQPF